VNEKRKKGKSNKELTVARRLDNNYKKIPDQNQSIPTFMPQITRLHQFLYARPCTVSEATKQYINTLTTLSILNKHRHIKLKVQQGLLAQ